MRPAGFLLPAATLLSGCWALPVRDEILAEPYHLVATDLPEEAVVCVMSDNVCEGGEIPGPMIFAAGGDARYIVAARHPGEIGKRPDRSRSEYYVLIRKPGDKGNVLRGPLTSEQFAAAKARYQLPEFTAKVD